MPGPRSKFLGLAAALALSGCSYTNGALDWASDAFTGTSSDTTSTTTTSDTTTTTTGPSGGTTVLIPASPAEANPQPTINASPLPGAPVASGAPPSYASPAPNYSGSSTTFVGMKAAALKAELGQFQGNLAQHQADLQSIRQSQAGNAQSYFTTVASINSRLQVGTTPGNPQLVAQWGQAQSMLDRMNSDVARLNALANGVASDSSFGNYLLNEVRSAYSLQGGIDSDRDQLHVIENQTIAGLTTVNQLLNNLSDEIGRQSGYIANERNNLVTLALAIQNGQLYGPSLANRNFSTTTGPTASYAPAPAPRPAPRAAAPRASSAPSASIGDDRPLVVIRFDQPNVDYEQPLYTAVSRALERKPDATFTIQAVAPNAGTPADVAVNTNASRQNAENVLRSLTSMGLPADRVSLSATMSPDVQASEVRIFVR
jgi:hypothetical protein